MNKKDTLKVLRITYRVLIRTVLVLLYTALLLLVGIFCGALRTMLVVNGVPSWIRATQNKVMTARNEIHSLPNLYVKKLTIPDKLSPLECNLLQTIHNEAPSMKVFPLDIIIDINQLDYIYALSQGAFEVSKTPDLSKCSGDIAIEESALRKSKITFYHLGHIYRRYDLSYDNFIPFYKFYLSALNATHDQVDECLDSFPNMSPKEKALALSAIYIYEQRARKPSKRCKRRYERTELKYNAYKIESSFNDEKWQYLESLLYDNSSNEEVAFDAVPNEGLIKQWETSLRRNALLYQYDLSYYNPFCRVQDEWAPLCRKASLSFLYALLWSETEICFLNSDKEFPRIPLRHVPHDYELDVIELNDNKASLNDQRIDRPFLTEEEKTRRSIVYNLNGKTNYSVTPNDYVITMREYLKTQESALRNFYPDGDGGRVSVFKYDLMIPPTLFDLHHVEAFNANTSYKAKTLGFIASTLLNARGLFED